LPIKELQQRLTQVGVIRLGEQRISKNNKPYPAKLDTFRVTSPSKDLVGRGRRAVRRAGHGVAGWPGRRPVAGGHEDHGDSGARPAAEDRPQLRVVGQRFPLAAV
jgi:hypothetical protein